MDKCLKVRICIRGCKLLCHYIANSQARETFSNLDLCAACTRRIQQEPTDEGNPQTSESRAAKETQNTQHDETYSNELAHSRSYASRTVRVSCDPPNHSTQDASTVEWKSGNHVEDGKGDVDEPQAHEHRHSRRRCFGGEVPAQQPGHSKANDSNRNAADWTNDAHPKL